MLTPANQRGKNMWHDVRRGSLAAVAELWWLKRKAVSRPAAVREAVDVWWQGQSAKILVISTVSSIQVGMVACGVSPELQGAPLPFSLSSKFALAVRGGHVYRRWVLLETCRLRFDTPPWISKAQLKDSSDLELLGKQVRSAFLSRDLKARCFIAGDVVNYKRKLYENAEKIQ